MNKEEMIARFKLTFPELTDTDNLVLDICYDFVVTRIKRNIWKAQFTEGFLYLLAHYVKMRTGGVDGGAITAPPMTKTSKSIGKMSVGYSDAAGNTYADAGEYALTVYGRHYYDIRKLVRPTGVVR